MTREQADGSGKGEGEIFLKAGNALDCVVQDGVLSTALRVRQNTTTPRGLGVSCLRRSGWSRRTEDSRGALREVALQLTGKRTTR